MNEHRFKVGQRLKWKDDKTPAFTVTEMKDGYYSLLDMVNYTTFKYKIRSLDSFNNLIVVRSNKSHLPKWW